MLQLQLSSQLPRNEKDLHEFGEELPSINVFGARLGSAITIWSYLDKFYKHAPISFLFGHVQNPKPEKDILI